MRKLFSSLFVFMICITAPRQAHGIDAELDRYETSIPMNQATVFNGTLRINGTAAVFITGVQVQLSNSATAEVYNPALLQERLRQLGPGQTWGGPLIVVTPKHRGPLVMIGAITIMGGTSSGASNKLASIPLHFTIDDPKRELNGRFGRWVSPACDRASTPCCEPQESLCVQRGEQCVYVADGFDKQQVCVNQQAAHVYEHISDLQVSSDAAHIAYIASRHCSQVGPDEVCERLIVVDGIEHKAQGAPTTLILSPDDRSYTYTKRDACVMRDTEEECTGSSHVITGAPVAAQ